MKVIAVINHKGGVGKTTTTASLGAALLKAGYKVLLIDLDGQANLSESLGVYSNEIHPTIYDALKGKVKDLPIYENNDGLHIVPSCLDLSAAETELISEPGRELILKILLKRVESDKYDYVLIDCPPSLGLLSLNALAACSSYIVPVQAHFLPMRGLGKLNEFAKLVKERINQDLIFGGVVVTMYDGRRVLDRDIVKVLKKEFQGKVFNTMIRHNIAAAEAPSSGHDVINYSPESIAAKDYIALAQELTI